MRTLIGLFGDKTEARENIEDLKRIGADEENISILSRDDSLGIGNLEMSPIDLPGLGRVAACGPMTTYLNRATATHAPDAILSALTGMGVPEVEARRYIAGVQRGYTLETIAVPDDLADEALEVMREHAIHERGTADTKRTGTAGEETILPVIVEELRVGKREVARGGVQVESHTEEIPVEEEISLREESVDVERRAVDRPVTKGDATFEDRTVEVIAKGEEAVVSKEARVVEEVVVKKNVDERSETVRDTVRKTDVNVRKFDPSEYKEHFQTAYKGRPNEFGQYEPAYRFGSELRTDQQLTGREWPDVERDAQTRWESKNPGTWNRFKDAIRHAWDRAKS